MEGEEQALYKVPRPPRLASPLDLASPSNNILLRLFKGRLVSTVTLGEWEGCGYSRVGRKPDIQGKNSGLNILSTAFLSSSKM